MRSFSGLARCRFAAWPRWWRGEMPARRWAVGCGNGGERRMCSVGFGGRGNEEQRGAEGGVRANDFKSLPAGRARARARRGGTATGGADRGKREPGKRLTCGPGSGLNGICRFKSNSKRFEIN